MTRYTPDHWRKRTLGTNVTDEFAFDVAVAAGDAGITIAHWLRIAAQEKLIRDRIPEKQREQV